MTRAALIAIALVPSPAAPVRATPVIGIGEQHPEMFSDQGWVDLASPHVRYVGSWDAMRHKRERGEVDRRQRTRPTLRTLRAQIRRYGR